MAFFRRLWARRREETQSQSVGRSPMAIRDEWEQHRRYVASDGTCFGALEQHIPDMPRAEGTFVLILRFTLDGAGRHVGERPVTSCKPAQARAETRRQAEEYERGRQGTSSEGRAE